MADAPAPRFQFSLLVLFGWMLALSVLFALTRLPWPLNSYFAPIYAAVLAGYAGSRSPWLSAVLGGIASLAAGYLAIVIEANPPLRPQLEVLNFPLVAGCCCFPGGAYVALVTGQIANNYRHKRRFRFRLKSLWREIAHPSPPAKPADELKPPEPNIQPDADD